MERNRSSREEWQRTVFLVAGAVLFIGTLFSVAAFQGQLVTWGQTDALHQAALAAVVVLDAALVSVLLTLGRRPRTEPVRVWRDPRR